MFYFYKGEGVLHFENKKYKIKKNDFVIIDAKKIHVEQSTEKNSLCHFILGIDNIKINGINYNSLSKNGLLFHSFNSFNNNIYKILKAIYNEFKNKKLYFETKVQCFTKLIVAESLRLLPEISNKLKPCDSIAVVKRFIENNYNKEINSDKLSEISYISKNHLIFKFKKIYGFTPNQYKNILRLEQSKMLLRYSNKNISEISIAIGYDNITYFSELFHKYVGTTPTIYRNTIDLKLF